MECKVADFYLTTRHVILLSQLRNDPGSCVIFYANSTRARILNGKHWCFSPSKNSNSSIATEDWICEDLVKYGILVSELNDEEFKAQKALGTQLGRIYRVSKDFQIKWSVGSEWHNLKIK